MNSTLVIFDLDHTITKKDTYLAFLLCVLHKHPSRFIRASWLPIAVLLYKLKLRDNSWLKKVFLQTIAGGLSRQQINKCKTIFLDTLIKQGLHVDALTTLQKHRDAGHQLIMATASFDFYCHELAQQLGFDGVICTQSVWTHANKLQGDIAGKNCYGEHKLAQVIEQFAEPRKHETMHFIAYSDHHSDLPLLNWVDHAVAVNPTKPLKKIARQQQFEIVNWV